MPGIPSIYYGSEYGLKGEKTSTSDDNLRPELNIKTISADGAAGTNQRLYRHIVRLGDIRMKNPAFAERANFYTMMIQNKYMLFKRDNGDHSVIVALNQDDGDYSFEFDWGGKLIDVLNNLAVRYEGNKVKVVVPAHSAAILVNDADAAAQNIPVAVAPTPAPAAAPTAPEPIINQLAAGDKYDVDGKTCEIIAIAKDAATKQDVIVYREPDGSVWVSNFE
jgi:glycosidase